MTREWEGIAFVAVGAFFFSTAILFDITGLTIVV